MGANDFKMGDIELSTGGSYVILVNWKAEIGRIVVQASLGTKQHPHLKNSQSIEGWGCDSSSRALA